MSVRIEIVEDFAAMRTLRDEWKGLAEQRDSSFHGPGWLFPWWHAYRRVLGAEPFVLTGRGESGELLCIAPLYRRTARLAPGLNVREVRLMGDAGPRPPAMDFTVAAGVEDSCGEAIADALLSRAADWDLVDLEPLSEPSRARAFAINRLSSSGLHVESAETSGARRITLDVAGLSAGELDPSQALRVYANDPVAVRKGLTVLRRLSRLEWAARDESSPLADEQARHFLEEVVVSRAHEGGPRLVRLDDSAGAAAAAALVVDHGEVAVVLALAVDPDTRSKDASGRLLAAEASAAHGRGRTAMDLVTGALEHPLPPLPCSQRRALRVSVYGSSGTAKVARTYGAVRRRVEAARVAPGAAAAGARAAWTKIRTAAADVTGAGRLHLYRAQLWTRGIEPPAGLSLRVLEESDFDAMEEREQADLRELLELDVGVCRRNWSRGDMLAYASINGRPAGIGWCSRTPVEVPELARTLRIGTHEAYIHDVFVSPQARGRAVAPSMLEFLSRELRQQDVYRCWALIGSENMASIRAFEKASYTAVADVIPGIRGRIKVRPADSEARQLLGLD